MFWLTLALPDRRNNADLPEHSPSASTSMADLQNMNRLLGRCLQVLQKNPTHFLNGQGVMVQVKVIGGDDDF